MPWKTGSAHNMSYIVCMSEAPAKNRLNGIPYKDTDIIHFESGLPGFERLHQFVLVEVPEYSPFEWLYSIDDPSIRFVVVNPMLFRPDYSPKVTREHLEQLGVRHKEDLRLLAIVTLHADFHLSTANLAGPLLLNLVTHVGMQLVIDDARYSVREPILVEGV